MYPPHRCMLSQFCMRSSADPVWLVSLILGFIVHETKWDFFKAGIPMWRLWFASCCCCFGDHMENAALVIYRREFKRKHLSRRDHTRSLQWSQVKASSAPASNNWRWIRQSTASISRPSHIVKKLTARREDSWGTLARWSYQYRAGLKSFSRRSAMEVFKIFA